MNGDYEERDGVNLENEEIMQNQAKGICGSLIELIYPVFWIQLLLKFVFNLDTQAKGKQAEINSRLNQVKGKIKEAKQKKAD